MRGEFGAGGAGGRGGGGTRVYVGGLDGEIKKEDIEYEFEKFGKLNSVWVAYNPPGFAFVEFAERRDAQAACDAMNNAEIMGARLRVELSRGRGRGRGGGRGGGFGRDEGGRGGGFRGGRGGDRGRGSSRGSGFRGGSGRGGFIGDSYRSRDRDGGRDAPPPRAYSAGGSGSYSATREPRFRSRSPHRFSSSGGGGTGSTGRREYGGGAGESFGRGGYQRNSYSRGGGY